MRLESQIERLEPRRLLADTGGPLVPITDISGFTSRAFITGAGTLVVKGSALPDQLSVRQEGNHFVAKREGGFEQRFAMGKVKRILIEGGGGSDRVHANPNLGTAVTLVGGSGNDTLEAGPGATLVGGAGHDKLVVEARTTPPVFAVRVTELGNTFNYRSIRFYGGPALLLGGAGNDTLVSSGGDDSVIGGAGNDLFIKSAGLLKITAPTTGTPTVAGVGLLSGIEQIQAFVGDEQGTVFFAESGDWIARES